MGREKGRKDLLPGQALFEAFLDIDRPFRRDRARAVLQAAQGRLGDSELLGELLSGKAMFLTEGPQNLSWGAHIDTHRIARSPFDAIPVVSDGASPRIYDAGMGESPKKSKAPKWALALDAHVRESKTITWAKIAAALDMTEGGIRHWRNGTREIKLSEFLALCKAAGADPAVMMHGGAAEGGAELEDARRADSPEVERLIRAFTWLMDDEREKLLEDLDARAEGNKRIFKEMGRKFRPLSDAEYRKRFPNWNKKPPTKPRRQARPTLPEDPDPE